MATKAPFQLKIAKRGATRPDVPFVKAIKPEPEEEGAMIIRGQPAGSKEEWRTSQALDILQMDYYYQYSVGGGRQRRGGQVIDFLVLTPVRWTIVDVRGTYWHTGRHEDSLDILRVARKQRWNLVILWDTDCKSVSDAVSFLRQKIPHG